MSTVESEASGRSRVEEDAGEREREREARFMSEEIWFLFIRNFGERAGSALEDL